MSQRDDIRRAAGDDTGAVAVIVALLIVAFLMLGALVVDVGYWYNVRRQLQAAADAAALAGCAEVIATNGDLDAALAKAEEYAALNAVAPGDGLEMIPPGQVNTETAHPYTEVTPEYVKVTVRKQAPVFLSALFGYSGGWIHAQSRADALWSTGAKAIVPWAVPVILTPNKVTVRVDGGTEYELDKQGDGWWRYYSVPAPAASASGHQLTFTVYNAANVPTSLMAAGVVVPEAGAPFTDIELDRYVVASGGTVTAFITSPTKPTGGKFGTRNLNAADFHGSDGEWHVHLTPTTDLLSATFPLDIEWTTPGGKYTLTNAAYVAARRTTFPINDAYANQHVLEEDGSFEVGLKLHSYVKDQLYELKVDSGAEVGNFCAIDLGMIFRPPSEGNPDPPLYDLSDDPNYRAPTYYNYLEFPFPFEIWIGDYIWTHPGNLSGPQTDASLDDRFFGDMYTWASWNGEDPPRPDTKRLVYVPIMEKVEEDGTTGRSRLVVVDIGAFFVPAGQDYRDTIRGYFVDYVTGGPGSPTPPPSGLGARTPCLVSTDIDF